MDLTITPKAGGFIRRMVRFGNAGGSAGFRLVVSPGGCSGLSSEFTIEAGPQFGDYVLEQEGLKIFLPEPSRALLDGYTIDFADTMMETGLKFFNPNARGACGCGSSAPGNTDPTVATISIASIARRQA
ncbi:MAG: iron-sulfur cluster assembly accessory protein [Sulfuricellaceae bacterium]|nr:iron-sulfur cluster assembly accessory protein [Sulfuricellaceae bacterium]